MTTPEEDAREEIFRRREGSDVSHYRVPLYPLPPLILAAACLWMLYSSITYAGMGSIIGVIVLFVGTPLLFLRRTNG